MLYILTIYRDNSKRDITNIEDFVTQQSNNVPNIQQLRIKVRYKDSLCIT